MNCPEQNVIQQIKKLLNLTEAKGATEAEAANAVNLAQKLALKRGLNLQEFSIEEEEVSATIEEDAVFTTANLVEWKVDLIATLVYANGCFHFWRPQKNVYNKKRRTIIKELIIVGTEFNRFIVIESFKYLEKVVETLAKEELEDTERRIRIKELFMPFGLNRREFLHSFKIGCSRGLQNRIMKSTKELTEQGTENCTAIVVANYLLENRNNAKNWVEKKHKLETMKSKKRIDRSDTLGYNLGKDAADTVDLSPQKALK